MIQRIYNAFKDSDFNPVAACTMWRQIIAASIHHESPLSLSVLQDEANSHLPWLAKEHFGNFVPLHAASNVTRVFGELNAGNANIGVLPYPDSLEESNWWQLMLQDESLKIFAYVPGVVPASMSQQLPHGLAFGEVMPEASGDDQSYFVLVLNKTMSSSHLQNIFAEAGSEATFLNAISQEPLRYLLVRVDGFHDTQSALANHITTALGESIDRLCWLGAHATPILEDERKATR